MLRSLLFVLAAASSVFANAGSLLARNASIEARASDALSFKWTSSAVLIQPKSDGTNLSALKDPSIVYYNGAYHVFVSTAQASGYNVGIHSVYLVLTVLTRLKLAYLTFTDFNNAQSATFHYLDQTAIGTGYRAAPQVFYFAPQKLWYLIYQDGNAAYSTNTDISNPSGWSAPKHFYSSVPSIITQNEGSGSWLDMWVICDSSNCYHFSEDDNGHVYRASTTLANFPNGMSTPVIALANSNKYDLFEASNVYKVGSQYLLIVECIGSTGHRYFRSWTASTLSGSWTELAASESNPFAGAANVQFPGGTWTSDISHGEAIRTNVDQTMTLPDCGPQQYLYQGLPTGSSGDYNTLPWKIALLTSTTVRSFLLIPPPADSQWAAVLTSSTVHQLDDFRRQHHYRNGRIDRMVRLAIRLTRSAR